MLHQWASTKTGLVLPVELHINIMPCTLAREALTYCKPYIYYH